METKELPGIWLLEAFRRGGVDTERLEREIPDKVHNLLHHPGDLVPSDVNIILCNCAKLSGDDNFGLHMIDLVDLSMLGTFGYLLANAPTVRRFLHFAQTYYPTFYRGSEVIFRSQGAISSLEYRVHVDADGLNRHDNEWSLGFFADFVGKKMEKGWHPIRTDFRNEAPADQTELRRIFGDEINFNAHRTAFEFASEDLDRSLNLADSKLLEILTDQAEELLKMITIPDSFLTAVRLQILEDLEKKKATIQEIAPLMAVSRSTFKRRLAVRGLSFRGLRNDVIRNVATKALMETDAEIGTIALKLGYSELSAFDRAFKRITGMSPTMYRKNRPLIG